MADTTTRKAQTAPAVTPGAEGSANHLFRNAYALMLNTGVSAVLGLGYWLIAARYYTEDAVGQGSAAIAAMKFLAGLMAVTLTGALTRFVPVSGRRAGRLIFQTYAGSSAIVAFSAAVFLLTLDSWGPSYRFLHGTAHGLGFIAAVVGWSLLTLQDGVLTGLRSALWVPVGNTVFSAGKLALLVVIAAAVPTAGVFVSWVAAIGLSVLPLGWLVFRRLVPRHVAATAGQGEPPTVREMGRFVAGDSTGSLFALAVVYLVPVLVASQISSADNAYFYVTMTIGGTIDLLAINMGSSLTVEGSHDPSRIAENCRAALRRMARIMVPIVVFLLVFAPRILGVFGQGYADEGAPLLRLLALCSLSRVLIEVFFGVLRAQSRTALLAVLQGVLCLLVLGLTLALLSPLGIVGAGWAELASLVVIALISLVGLRRVMAAPTAPSAPAAPEAPVDVPSAGDDLEVVYGTRWAKRAAALDQDTLHLGVRLDFDHPERRPPVAPTAEQTSPRTPISLRPPWAPLAVWGLLACALALYWLPLHGMGDAQLDAMDGLGLISVLPKATLAGALLLVVAFAAALRLRTARPWLLLAVLLATVVSLHSLPAVLEAQPRFATAWQHAGFIDYIGRTGIAAPDMDARFSWPGFFAAVAFVARACGVTDLTEVLRWWPLVMQLLYLAPLMLVLRTVRADWRAKWCAAWLFALCGWVGQDYFSPQSLNYLIYLMFVAVLLVFFRSPSAASAIGRADRAVLLALLFGLFAASVVSHQLTPFMMLGALTVLVLVRRCTLRGLPLLCGVLLVGWIGFLAEPYWSGHFNELFGGLGSLGGNVSSSVSGRIQGGSSVHKLVLYARVLLAAGVLTLAALGWLRRRRVPGTDDRALVVLLLVPFCGFGMQSYGGEMALRVFLFALPGACALAALAFFPRTTSARPWLGPLAALVAGCVLMVGFLVARWGNEPFERVRTGEVAAMDYVYAHDAPSGRVLWLSTDPVNDVTPSLPWNARDMEKVTYVPVLAPTDPVRVQSLVRALQDAGPQSYLVVSRGQTTYLQLDAGFPANWPGKLLGSLDARSDLRRVLVNDDAAIYELRKQPSDWPVRVPQPERVFPVITWTAWTVVGAVAGLALLLLLGARELARVTLPLERRRRGMRLSLLAAAPLLVLFLVALVDRFLTLS
ncbi:lipopolysaccharide biosynthesis protein [Streptomyces sp. NPDC059373]